MPFLDAKALEIDPNGMSFLRSVIRPDFEQEQQPLRPRRTRRLKADSQARTEPSGAPVRADEAAAVPVG